MKKQHLQLTVPDKLYLETLLSKGSLQVSQQKRAQALLALDKGKTYQEVSTFINTSYPTISKWASKYKATGLSFLEDKPRSGRPVQLSGAERAKITALACSTPPAGYARWSLRLLSDKLVELEIVDSISFKQVGNILKKMNYSRTVKDNGAFDKSQPNF